MITTKRSKLFSKIVTYIVLIAFAVLCIFPLLWMMATAIKPEDEIRTAIPTFVTLHPTFDNFSRVLMNNGFLLNIRNSLLVAVFTTIVSLVVSMFAAYTMSRYGKFKEIKLSGAAMLISQMVPGVLLLVPLFIIMKEINLIDTYLSLIIAYTTFSIPMCTFILKGFYDTLPHDLEESAEIDGCSKLGIIFKIIVPISIPSLISTGLYAFVLAWNEFMFGYVFINSESIRTITPAIKMFQGSNITDWGGLMAASTLAVLPITIVFLFFQKYFVSGLTAGSVKG
ncbi:carbohydrate ABC transporter permease [Gracilibacillus salinarum]|uniref:Carbohydrate ABC transporter permease n=1 Tax=Gracilibacillus salinarum TaxID=2932255 RepID=A0ABY4GSM5_9BACI|nr:carbohydrate ABC transporter permease [Gracilibacillus salinarum]UOQ86975.1 carbohydrate ABC transporter permease [Gracilibacillus salinarum]